MSPSLPSVSKPFVISFPTPVLRVSQPDDLATLPSEVLVESNPASQQLVFSSGPKSLDTLCDDSHETDQRQLPWCVIFQSFPLLVPYL